MTAIPDPPDWNADEQTAAEFLAELRAEARARRWVQGEPPRCPICGATGHDPQLRADGWHWTTVHLGYCAVGQVFANPRPIHELLPADDRHVHKVTR